MIPFDEVIRLHGLKRAQLTLWIERRWVRPQVDGAEVLFDEADVARVALIRELRDDLSVDDEAVPLVLGLLDQLYAARQVLRNVSEAIDSLPPPLKDEFRKTLGRG